MKNLVEKAVLFLTAMYVTNTAYGSVLKSKESQAAKLCQMKLYSPENGQINELVEEKPKEFAVTFKCNPGYRMEGQSKSTCKDGKWTGRFPWCKTLCKFVSCEEGQKCIVDELFSATKCVCKNIFECPFEYKPVCGSDHVTYASKCILGMTACQKKQKISLLAEEACPKGIFVDSSCSECPRIRICPALYKSQYAFLGKLTRLNETTQEVYLNFKISESYKGLELKNNSKDITLVKKKIGNACNCVPFIPSGKSYIFGIFKQGSNGVKLLAFDEHTFVEKFYSHKQMSLCWLY